MSGLYKDLAKIYQAMYATLIDYEGEYKFYSEILKRYGKSNLVEVGCGTGNLTQLFKADGFDYIGLDLNDEMLDIARKENPDTTFLKEDMRVFLLDKSADSIIITGRTISYLITNNDVDSALKSIHNNLEKGGLLSFDFIDANVFIPQIYNGKEVTHEASHKGIDYLRKSLWHPNLKNGMDFRWESTYYQKERSGWTVIGKDNSTIRTFTLNELEIFLEVNGFDIREVIEKESYAFPTYVIVAEKA